MKTIPVFVAIVLLSMRASANCELEWVSAVEKNQNWIHTVATHPEETAAEFVLPQLTADRRLDLSCVNGSLCEDLKALRVGAKTCPLPKLSRVVKPASGEDESSYTWQGKPCQAIAPTDAAFIEGRELVLLSAHPLIAQPTQTLLAKDETAIRSSVKKVMISEFPVVEVDLSSKLEKQIVVSSSPKAPDFAIGELKAKIALKEIPGVCDKGCTSPTRMIEIPVLVMKRAGAWHLFGHGRIGACSGHNGVSEPSLETKLLQPFGAPSRFAVYDIDGDGKPDALRLSARPHFPGSVHFYRFKPNAGVETIGELCVPTVGACEPAPGC